MIKEVNITPHQHPQLNNEVSTSTNGLINCGVVSPYEDIKFGCSRYQNEKQHEYNIGPNYELDPKRQFKLAP